MNTADFVVIGGGIAGASAAYELAAHGRVVLLEREAVCGHHTTGRSAAVFTEAYEKGAVRGLALASRSFLEEPPAGFGDGAILSPRGFMMIGTRDQAHLVASAYESARAAVPAVRWLTPDQAMAVCPVLRPGYVEAATLEPEARTIDVHALHQGYLTALRRRGGEVRTGATVIGLRPRRASWHIELAEGAHVAAAAVVNAAGAWAEEVGALAGAPPIGLRPLRRTAFTFAPPEGLDLDGIPMVVDAEELFYFKPEGPQFLASLAEETPMAPHDVRHDEADVALAIERIEAATTMRIRHVRSAWAGLRSFVADRNPVIGPEPGLPGFYWLAGQGGFGIMTSPAAARTLAAFATGGDLPPDVAVDPADVLPERLR